MRKSPISKEETAFAGVHNFQGAMHDKIANFKERKNVCRVQNFSGGRCVIKSPISKEETAFAGYKHFQGRCVIKSPISKEETAFARVHKFSGGDA